MKVIYLISSLLLFQCSSSKHVAHEYKEKQHLKLHNSSEKPQTLIFFLVDGLSVPLTQKLFRDNQLPHIRNFFVPSSQKIFIGRSVFPTLTHTNISSILTSKNVSQHPVIGNKIYLENTRLNFEFPGAKNILSDLIRPQSIFTDFKKQNRKSLSFAPYYGDQATGRYGFELNIGVAYSRGDYSFVDTQIVRALQNTLSQIQTHQWPEFIFVHLVGIDGYAHSTGQFSSQTISHAKKLDSLLSPVFALLSKAQKAGRSIGAVLTSDHGMMNIKRKVNLEPLILKTTPKSITLNQSRFISIYFPQEKSNEDNTQALKKLALTPGVELTAEKNSNQVKIYTPKNSYTIYTQETDCGIQKYSLSFDGKNFLCPTEFNKKSMKFIYPYLATNLAEYFRAPHAPHALVIAAQGISFAENTNSSHGGPTPEELLVPMMFWNLDFKSEESEFPTYRLLEEIRAE